MAIEKVPITVTAIQELLNNGYTWLKKDDLGFGSIQEKFKASDIQIATIRKHPLLKSLETTARVFVIIDDTKNEKTEPNGITTTVPVDNGAADELLESLSGPDKYSSSGEREVVGTSNTNHESTVSSGTTVSDEDSFSAFANL